MGFKNLSMFNDALLAKQTWRLLHNIQSLFYRVFKAKYFPNTTVMGGKNPNNSYAWKSIIKGRDVRSSVENQPREFNPCLGR